MGKPALLPLPPLVGMLDKLHPVRMLDMLLLVVTPESTLKWAFELVQMHLLTLVLTPLLLPLWLLDLFLALDQWDKMRLLL